jgi:uncharacterized tellurite resistance protein B-like protein
MINLLKKFISENEEIKDDKSISHDEKKIQIATCALFIEIAKADNDFSIEEREEIISYMKDSFLLTDEHVSALLEFSEREVNDSVSIYEFTSVINQSFSSEQKFSLLKNLWRLIYVDRRLDTYEDNLIKKIGATLNLSHSVIISAKMLVKKEMGL